MKLEEILTLLRLAKHYNIPMNGHAKHAYFMPLIKCVIILGLLDQSRI